MKDFEVMPLSVVLAALAVIAVLAIVLPFTAITALHTRRLDLAEAALRVLERRIGVFERGATGAAILVSAGESPRSTDPRWTSAPSARLGDLGLGADPWGNTYVVNVGVPLDAAIWVLSAGPDGIIDTPFTQTASTATVHGDDLARRLRLVPGH